MSYQKIDAMEKFNKKSCLILLWTCPSQKTEHLPLNNHFLQNKYETLENVSASFSTVQNKIDNFILKILREKNNETTEHEQNISLKPKEIKIFPEDSALKGPLTNAMPKILQH